MTNAEKREAARQFVNKWQGRGKEDEDDRSFWFDIMQNVMGQTNVTDRIRFQKKVIGHDGNTKRIDAYIEETKVLIERTAQAILDARALYPDSSLADLYDPLTMPIDLRKAHQANDRVVMQAYGFDVKGMSEEDCIIELMKMYQNLVNGDEQ